MKTRIRNGAAQNRRHSFRDATNALPSPLAAPEKAVSPLMATSVSISTVHHRLPQAGAHDPDNTLHCEPGRGRRNCSLASPAE
jgi:hypothetical protein